LHVFDWTKKKSKQSDATMETRLWDDLISDTVVSCEDSNLFLPNPVWDLPFGFTFLRNACDLVRGAETWRPLDDRRFSFEVGDRATLFHPLPGGESILIHAPLDSSPKVCLLREGCAVREDDAWFNLADSVWGESYDLPRFPVHVLGHRDWLAFTVDGGPWKVFRLDVGPSHWSVLTRRLFQRTGPNRLDYVTWDTARAHKLSFFVTQEGGIETSWPRCEEAVLPFHREFDAHWIWRVEGWSLMRFLRDADRMKASVEPIVFSPVKPDDAVGNSTTASQDDDGLARKTRSLALPPDFPWNVDFSDSERVAPGVYLFRHSIVENRRRHGYSEFWLLDFDRRIVQRVWTDVTTGYLNRGADDAGRARFWHCTASKTKVVRKLWLVRRNDLPIPRAFGKSVAEILASLGAVERAAALFAIRQHLQSSGGDRPPHFD
jgi:hypothetical protein